VNYLVDSSTVNVYALWIGVLIQCVNKISESYLCNRSIGIYNSQLVSGFLRQLAFQPRNLVHIVFHGRIRIQMNRVMISSFFVVWGLSSFSLSLPTSTGYLAFIFKFGRRACLMSEQLWVWRPHLVWRKLKDIWQILVKLWAQHIKEVDSEKKICQVVLIKNVYLYIKIP